VPFGSALPSLLSSLNFASTAHPDIIEQSGIVRTRGLDTRDSVRGRIVSAHTDASSRSTPVFDIVSKTSLPKRNNFIP
jgi:hypothetical protein